MGRSIALLAAACSAALACRDPDAPIARSPAAPPRGDARDEDAATGPFSRQAPALPGGVRDVDGVVVRARAGHVVIRPVDGEAVVLALDPDVPVTVEGRVSSAAEIHEGNRVRAAYTFEDGDARAVRIELERPDR
jgi:hypothetical protein